MDRVILRRWRSEPKTLIAFLPDSECSPGYMLSYEHMGQHGEAVYPHSGTIPVKNWEIDQEAGDLVNELKNLGYNVKVIKRLIYTKKHLAKAS